MSKNDNILNDSKDLREMPFGVPEGYFEGLSAKVRDRIAQKENSETAPVRRILPFPTRFIPYISVAAVLAVIVAIGLLFGLRSTKTVVPEDGLDDSDYIFYYTEIVPVTEPESIFYYSYSTTNDELSYDDIVEYLINSGVDVETLYYDLN